MKRLFAVVAVALVLAATSTAMGACGNENDAKALFEEVVAVWEAKDATAAGELYNGDAALYWNWHVHRQGQYETTRPTEMARGIEEIGQLVASGAMGLPKLYGEDVYTLDLPVDESVLDIWADYRGAQFIAAPVSAEHELYMMVLEVRDGKIQNEFIEAMYSMPPPPS